MPVPGTMILPTLNFTPPLIKGITVFQDNPLKFDFLIHNGQSNIDGVTLEEEAMKQIKYFLAALTTPEDEMWVNLSPYEKDRIIPESFGVTEMGKDLLMQDYILKQLTASLIYPEDELGKEFWERTYKRAYELLGTTDIPINTFNKIWIVPEKAVVYEKGSTVFVLESKLKVMLEEDYKALKHNLYNEQLGTDQVSDSQVEQLNEVSSQIVREVLIPEIEREVNYGENFVELRQIYNAMILAAWYKNRLKQSLLGQIYVDQNKVAGVDVQDKEIKLKIYGQYVEAFKKGVYNFIKDEYDSQSQEMVSKTYFSGGFDTATLSSQILEVAPRDSALVSEDVEEFKADVLAGRVKTVEAYVGETPDAAMTASPQFPTLPGGIKIKEDHYTRVGRSNEDRYVDSPVVMDLSDGRKIIGRLMAVADGTLGSEIADLIKNTLYRVFKNSLVAANGDEEEAMRKTFAYYENLSLNGNYVSGASVSIVFANRTGSTVTGGILGNTRVIVLNQEGREVFNSMGIEHSMGNGAVKNEVERRGGVFGMAGERLIFVADKKARAINLLGGVGFSDLQGTLIRTPHVFKMPYQTGFKTAIFSDGVYSLGKLERTPEQREKTDKEIRRLLILSPFGRIAEVLVQQAFGRGASDDLTAIVDESEPIPSLAATAVKGWNTIEGLSAHWQRISNSEFISEHLAFLSNFEDIENTELQVTAGSVIRALLYLTQFNRGRIGSRAELDRLLESANQLSEAFSGYLSATTDEQQALVIVGRRVVNLVAWINGSRFIQKQLYDRVEGGAIQTPFAPGDAAMVTQEVRDLRNQIQAQGIVIYSTYVGFDWLRDGVAQRVEGLYMGITDDGKFRVMVDRSDDSTQVGKYVEIDAEAIVKTEDGKISPEVLAQQDEVDERFEREMVEQIRETLKLDIDHLPADWPLQRYQVLDEDQFLSEVASFKLRLYSMDYYRMSAQQLRDFMKLNLGHLFLQSTTTKEIFFIPNRADTAMTAIESLWQTERRLSVYWEMISAYPNELQRHLKTLDELRASRSPSVVGATIRMLIYLTQFQQGVVRNEGDVEELIAQAKRLAEAIEKNVRIEEGEEGSDKARLLETGKKLNGIIQWLESAPYSVQLLKQRAQRVVQTRINERFLIQGGVEFLSTIIERQDFRGLAMVFPKGTPIANMPQGRFIVRVNWGTGAIIGRDENVKGSLKKSSLAVTLEVDASNRMRVIAADGSTVPPGFTATLDAFNRHQGTDAAMVANEAFAVAEIFVQELIQNSYLNEDEIAAFEQDPERNTQKLADLLMKIQGAGSYDTVVIGAIEAEKRMWTARRTIRTLDDLKTDHKGAFAVGLASLFNNNQQARIIRAGDAAMVGEEKENVGGIDLAPGFLDLQIKRDGNGVPLPVNMQDLPAIQIDGLYPVIINITPVTNLPLLLGEIENEESIASSI
ncbi:MAG TPA: hypothetical protein VI749_02705 [Candidatus Omnitrophota bacterium]|nr:hypothetical protein [Candidatus Omnitrophota bacterium]